MPLVFSTTLFQALTAGRCIDQAGEPDYRSTRRPPGRRCGSFERFPGENHPPRCAAARGAVFCPVGPGRPFRSWTNFGQFAVPYFDDLQLNWG